MLGRAAGVCQELGEELDRLGKSSARRPGRLPAEREDACEGE